MCTQEEHKLRSDKVMKVNLMIYEHENNKKNLKMLAFSEYFNKIRFPAIN